MAGLRGELLGPRAVDAAGFAHREHHVRARILLNERLGDLVVALGPGQGAALDLVHDEPVDLLKRVAFDAFVEGGRVEGDLHALRVAAVHDVGDEVDLVLQNRDVAGLEVREHLVDPALRELLVRAAVGDDAVLAVLVDLDDRVAARAFAGFHEVGVHALLAQLFSQESALLPDDADMVRPRARLRQRDGLVEPLAAAADREGFARLRLAGLDVVLHLIDVVDVDGADIDNFHGISLLWE